MTTMEKRGIKAEGREVIETNGRYQLSEPVIFNKLKFTPENGD